MAEHTPTTADVRVGYVVHTTTAMNPDLPVPVAAEAFDRWLAAHDREVAAKALRSWAQATQDQACAGYYNPEQCETCRAIESARIDADRIERDA